jgi:hypothetical protein
VKELAASPDGDRYAEALHMLFDLDRNTPGVLSVPTTDDPVADPVPGAAAAALAAGRAPGGPGSEAR